MAELGDKRSVTYHRLCRTQQRETLVSVSPASAAARGRHILPSIPPCLPRPAAATGAIRRPTDGRPEPVDLRPSDDPTTSRPIVAVELPSLHDNENKNNNQHLLVNHRRLLVFHCIDTGWTTMLLWCQYNIAIYTGHPLPLHSVLHWYAHI